MAPIAQQVANMVEMLPEQDQALALELVKKLVLAWDPDYTRTTPAEKLQIDRAAAEIEAGEYITDSAINWNWGEGWHLRVKITPKTIAEKADK